MSHQGALGKAVHLINSECVAPDGEIISKRRMRSRNKAPSSSFLYVLSLFCDGDKGGSLPVILENEKPVPYSVGLGIMEVEATLLWVCFCTLCFTISVS